MKVDGASLPFLLKLLVAKAWWHFDCGWCESDNGLNLYGDRDNSRYSKEESYSIDDMSVFKGL